MEEKRLYGIALNAETAPMGHGKAAASHAVIANAVRARLRQYKSTNIPVHDQRYISVHSRPISVKHTSTTRTTLDLRL